MKLEFNFEAVPKFRMRIRKLRSFAQLYKDPRLQAFERKVNEIAKVQLPENFAPIDYPIKVIFRFYIRKPKLSRNVMPCVKPDLSNFIKSVEDGLNGAFWTDDKIIVELQASKEYSTRSYFTVEAIPIGDIQGHSISD